MSWKKTDDTYYDEIAAAIRSKNGTQNTYTPPQMGAAINNVQTIEELNSDNLINPVILNGTSVAPHLFYGKQSITNIIFPNVVSIGDYAFESCANLAITSLPSGVIAIGTYAFHDCTSLALTSLPSGLKSIGNNAFRRCSHLAFTELPNSVETLGDYTFKEIQGLALTRLSDNLVSIGEECFMGCTNLALTSLPDGLTKIPAGCFRACTNLAITSLPSGITSIGNYAFYQCPNIPFLDFSEFDHIPTLGTNNFIGANSRYPFYFRDQQQLDQWAAATNWSTLASRFQIKPSGVI